MANTRTSKELTGALEAAVSAFVEDCADPSRDLPDIIGRFHDVIAIVGFTNAALGGGVLVDGDWTWRLYFNSQPPDWIAILDQHQLLRKGLPGNSEVYHRTRPFETLSAARSRVLTPLEKEGYDRQIAYGWRTIYTVPIYGPLGYRGALHCSSKDEIELTPRIMSALWLAGLELHERCYSSEEIRQAVRDPGLTWRELECLQLVAVGLTDKEIGRRIGISFETVRDHVERGCRKLRVKSRTGAAALLALMGKNAIPADLYQSSKPDTPK